MSRVGASKTPRSGPTGDRDNRRRPHAVRPAEDRVRQIHGPCETLKTLPETASLLTPGTTFAELDRVAVARSDKGAARPMDEALDRLFRSIESPASSLVLASNRSSPHADRLFIGLFAGGGEIPR